MGPFFSFIFFLFFSIFIFLLFVSPLLCEDFFNHCVGQKVVVVEPCCVSGEPTCIVVRAASS